MLSRSGNVITKCSAFLFVASCSCCARGFAGLCKRKIYGTFVICSNWSLYNSKECNVSLQKDRVSRHVAAYLNDSECIQHWVGWIQRFSFAGPARDGHAPAQPEWHLWSLRHSCSKFGFTSGNIWQQYLIQTLRERQLTQTNAKELLIRSGQRVGSRSGRGETGTAEAFHYVITPLAIKVGCCRRGKVAFPLSIVDVFQSSFGFIISIHVHFDLSCKNIQKPWAHGGAQAQ